MSLTIASHKDHALKLGDGSSVVALTQELCALFGRVPALPVLGVTRLVHLVNGSDVVVFFLIVVRHQKLIEPGGRSWV